LGSYGGGIEGWGVRETHELMGANALCEDLEDQGESVSII